MGFFAFEERVLSMWSTWKDAEEVISKTRSERPELLEEQEYRRGYRDGWIQATNALQDIWFLKKLDYIRDALFDFWRTRLSAWQKTDRANRFLFAPTNVLLCAYCENRTAEHLDHFIPKSKGGTSARGNLVPSCARCNMQKRDKMPWEWKPGLTKPPRHV